MKPCFHFLRKLLHGLDMRAAGVVSRYNGEDVIRVAKQNEGELMSAILPNGAKPQMTMAEMCAHLLPLRVDVQNKAEDRVLGQAVRRLGPRRRNLRRPGPVANPAPDRSQAGHRQPGPGLLQPRDRRRPMRSQPRQQARRPPRGKNALARPQARRARRAEAQPTP